MDITLEDLAKKVTILSEQQGGNFAMLKLLRENLNRQQELVTVMAENIRLLNERITKLEKAAQPLPMGGAWFDPRGGIA